MSMSDPIADMLTRVRNASLRQHHSVPMPYSKMKEAIAKVLKDEGYIKDFQVLSQKPRDVLQIELKYVGGRRELASVITGIERVSKPGRRQFVGTKKVPWVMSGMGISILTTSRGVMTGQQARRQGIGGEIICKVW